MKMIILLSLFFYLNLSFSYEFHHTKEFSHDGKYFVVAVNYETPNLNSKILIREAKTGEVVQSFTANYGDAGNYYVPIDAHFSSDGKIFAFSDKVDNSYVIKLYSADNWLYLGAIGSEENLDLISDFAFSPDNSKIYALHGYFNKSRNFHVWDVKTRQLIMPLGFPTEGEKDFVGRGNLFVIPDHNFVIAANWFNGIDFWSYETGKYVGRKFYGWTYKLAFMADHRHFLGIPVMGNFYLIYDLLSDQITALDFKINVNNASFSLDQKYLVVGADDGTSNFVGKVEVHDVSDIKNPQIIWKDYSHTANRSCGVQALKIAPDNSILIVDYAFGYSRAYDLKTGTILYEM